MLGKIPFHEKMALLDRFTHPMHVWEHFSIAAANHKSRIKTPLTDPSLRERARSILHQTENEGIDIIDWSQDTYPALLRQIQDPPFLLYSIGNRDCLKYCFGIVGSRKASAYGKHCAKKIAFDLAKFGISIVSGLARGIDAMAHIGALEAKGSTVAVLGCGINVVYPYENRNLYRRIADQGLLLSEYPPDTKPLPYFFPTRNRIISGLSRGVLVVEASKKSGSLITVDCALSQGREVFAVPGNITGELSTGTNRLIYSGASPYLDASDVLSLFGIDGPATKEFPVETTQPLDQRESRIYHLMAGRALNAEEIRNQTKWSMDLVRVILLSLEMKALVKKQPNEKYIHVKQGDGKN